VLPMTLAPLAPIAEAETTEPPEYVRSWHAASPNSIEQQS
jgi:hypothetical protein